MYLTPEEEILKVNLLILSFTLGHLFYMTLKCTYVVGICL